MREDFPEFFPKEVDASPPGNGWDLLSKLQKMPAKEREGLLPSAQADLVLSPLDADKVRTCARRFKENLAIMDRVIESPGLSSHDWRTFTVDSKGELSAGNVLHTTELMLSLAAVEAQEGNAARGMEQSLRLIRHGLRACEAEPLFIDLMVNTILMRIGARTISSIASLPGLDSAALRKAARGLEQCDTVRAAMRRGYLGEARWSLLQFEPFLKGGEERREAMLKIAAAGEATSAILSGTGPDAKPLPTIESLLEKWRKDPPRRIKAALRDMNKVDWGGHTRALAGYHRAVLDADSSSLPAFRASFHPPERGAAIRGTAVEPLLKSPVDITEMNSYMYPLASSSAAIRQARAVLLLRAFELDHGRPADSLEELIPHYWPSVPADPYDGKPLRYDASTRKVWCVGPNLIDEKGAEAENLEESPDDCSMTVPGGKTRK